MCQGMEKEEIICRRDLFYHRKSLGIIMAKERELTIEEQGKSRKVLSFSLAAVM